MAEIKLICPACGHEAGLEHFTQAAGLLALDRAAAAFGEDWPLIKEYSGLFGGQRPLKLDKRLRVIREIFKIYKSGQFEFNRAWYRVGRPEFLEALKSTCNQVTPPLSNHHYLFTVLKKAAQQTSRRQEREFREREDGLRFAGRDATDQEAVPELAAKLDDPQWRAQASELS
ncbi:MAG: hypothetical protein M1438_03190, partial [Deltaproteobacteria bacterium]|nr:hypothetical protein [Deltaproteobacteria bacterium]